MKHVLVVDDEAEIREMLLDCLESHGYRAEAVPDGRSALDWLADHETDMVLLDILRTMDSDDVDFMLDRNDNAGVVLPAADGGELKHQCLLMPLRLGD